MLLTGARRGEALAAKWQDIDFKTGTWSKPAATTKQRKLHHVPLSEAALHLLRELRARVPADVPWLFPTNGGGHRKDVKDSWTAISKAAGIPDVRVHDLRHPFASVLASGVGASLPLIGALLGHTSAQTTMRYSHLFDDVQRAAVNEAGAIITGQAKAAVIPLPSAQRPRRA